MDWLAQVISSSSAVDPATTLEAQATPAALRLEALAGLHVHISALTGSCARTLVVIQTEGGPVTRELGATSPPADAQPLCAAMLQLDGRDFRPVCFDRAELAALQAAAQPSQQQPCCDCPAARGALLTAALATPDPRVHVVTVIGLLHPDALHPTDVLAAELRAHPERIAELAGQTWRASPSRQQPAEVVLRELAAVTARIALLLMQGAGLFERAQPDLDHIAEAATARNHMAQAQAQLALQRHYLASLVHDLRAPLAAVLGHVELLQMSVHGAINDNQARALQAVHRRAQSALEMVGSILDFARARNSRARVPLDRILLKNLIDRALNAVQIDAERKELGLHIAFEDGAESLEVVTSEMRLEQILINLLSNAVKFTDAGGITLTIRRPRDDHFELIVEDTGVGIPTSEQERIFLPYRRASATATRAGTGLGLAISRAIVESMGGRLSVQSEVGRGSRFTIRLPIDSEPVD